MSKSDFNTVKIHTKNQYLLWKNARGLVNDKVAEKMDEVMLEWMVELTDCLSIWIDKGEKMTNGELILARTNMGTLVESWLKFFYCVFYIDYLNDPIISKGKMIEPNNMEFCQLQHFSVVKIWENENDFEYIWVNKIRDLRNSIHAFNYKDIGTAKDFLKDLEKYYMFVEHIIFSLPPIEEYIEVFPEGYTLF